jgi:hypothetical protein
MLPRCASVRVMRGHDFSQLARRIDREGYMT